MSNDMIREAKCGNTPSLILPSPVNSEEMVWKYLLEMKKQTLSSVSSVSSVRCVQWRSEYSQLSGMWMAP